MILILAAIWLAGAWLRIHRQARFYQIEEYMSRRYLRWYSADRKRLAPIRPLAAWLLGLALAVAFGDAPGSPPAVITILAALVAVYPQRQLEIKKKLVVTARVKRLLFGAALLPVLAQAALVSAVGAPAADFGSLPRLAAAHAFGIILLLSAPLWLVGGNALMQPLEAWLRRRYLRAAAAALSKIHPLIIGITGSYGKTTTKSYLREILGLRYHTYATPKSYNTLMGISLAINRDLSDDYRSEVFISEMGAYVEGEIARICQLTPPDIAIITEVGPQHLERFGSLENVKQAKYELIKHLPADGAAIFNWDNPYIREMVALGYPATRLTVSRELTIEQGREQGLAWIADDIHESLAGIRFRATHLKSGAAAQIETQVLGDHNVTNLLLCIATALHLGIPLNAIALRIRALKPVESRLVRETTAAGITIINDAYSANPKSVASALKVLRMHDTGARLLITPGMVEMGPLQDAENHKLGMIAAESATDIILIGGAQTQSILEAIQSTSFDPGRIHVVETLKESVAWYQQHLRAGDTVLFLNDLPDTY